MLAAGRLRERVTFLTPSSTQDALGQPTNAWTTFAADVFAEVQPMRSREAMAGGNLEAMGTVTVTVRYREDITPAMRVLWRGKQYRIVGEPIDVGAAREALQMVCTVGDRTPGAVS